MATEAQMAANRLNARKSTGPRTDGGKAVVAQNAVRHGLRAEQAVIKGEDPGEFEFYRDEMLGELSPAGAMESILAERAVGLAWRLRRAERVQAQVFDSMLLEDATSVGRKFDRSSLPKAVAEEKENLALGRVVVRDFSNARVLDRLGLYERRIEQSLYKTMAELQKLRLSRELDEGNHRQATLDAAIQAESTPEAPSQTEDEPLRQTKPIWHGRLGARQCQSGGAAGFGLDAGDSGTRLGGGDNVTLCRSTLTGPKRAISQTNGRRQSCL